jgi:hypothetical protein
MQGAGVDWIPSGLGLGRVRGFCENGNETSIYRKSGDFSTKETFAAEKLCA